MVGFAQVAVVAAFFGGMVALADVVAGNPHAARAEAAAPAVVESEAARKTEEERCKVPDFAIAMGHAEKWKLHNNCK